MNKQSIVQQSKNAYKQWNVQWHKHAKIHSSFSMKPLHDFNNIGIGKAILCIANGASFEENLDVIKKYQDNVDILVCDKTLGHCIANGIKPTYCMLQDANVDYEAYLKPYEDQLQDTVLFSNVCANPKWTHNGNWKDTYFLINEDVMHYEIEFSKTSGCKNFIPAGTNVSNAMIILLTQCGNPPRGRKNFFGYDKMLLIGFDYSWKDKYYSFDHDSPKTNYMRHVYLTNGMGEIVYTSNNLKFSAEWFEKYCSNFRLPIVNCSKNGILHQIHTAELENQMQYKYNTESAVIVRKLNKEYEQAMNKVKMIGQELGDIAQKHYFNFMETI